MLSKQDLFGRLAAGHAAGITVVTPNRRLAQSLVSEFDAVQTKNHLSVWEAPDILPVDAFVARLWEDAIYSDLGAELPLLLTDAQEQRLWEEILAASGLLAIPEAAAQCREAWRLQHAWRISPAHGNEDAAAFSRWAGIYRKKTSKDVDAARLPELMAGLIGKLKAPKLLVAYAFDVLPPQTEDFLKKLHFTECKPEGIGVAPIRTSFPSSKLEIEAAAKWARARLEEGRSRIGVVIPDLHQRRREVARVFSRVMGGARPFDISIGQPLAAYPLVGFALEMLRFSHGEIEFENASRLIRSPFLGGAESEMTRRATLDTRLRRNAEASISLPKLVALVEACPLLQQVLKETILVARESKPKTAGEWARYFTALLEAAGFPGERTPDSEEFQTLRKWNEQLAEFAKLERISKDFSFDEALAFLRRHCAGTLFQPESPDAPVQVLGLLESAGLRFDCLWVSGLTDEAWPLAARPNPFLPIRAQKAAGIPQAGAEASLEFDRRITAQWKGAAKEVIFSCALKDKDRDLTPSPLILDVAEGPVNVSDYPRYRDLLFENRKLQSFEDRKAPPVPASKVRGGTRVLADQAACPFRAFARWRLAAEALDEPSPGLDAMDRGTLVHALMKFLWLELKSSSSLSKKLEAAISRAAAAAVKEFGLEGGLAELERERLAKLAREWLEVEKSRSPFSVAALEGKRQITVGNLELSGRIDRIDRLEGGGHALIDYKSGSPMVRHWDGPRPDDPQLPLYAVAAREELSAVAFARVKTGGMKFIGLSKEEDLLPGVNPAHSWSGLLAQWKRDTEALGAAFAAGDARVDPKEGLKTCERCDLQTLCRVYEKFSALDEGAGVGE